MTAAENQQRPGCPQWCKDCMADAKFPEERMHHGDDREIELTLQPLDSSGK